MAPKISFSSIIEWIWVRSFNCLIKTFASACVIFGAALPYLFWLGFGPWPYYAFLVLTQAVFAFLGLGVIAGILRNGRVF